MSPIWADDAYVLEVASTAVGVTSLAALCALVLSVSENTPSLLVIWNRVRILAGGRLNKKKQHGEKSQFICCALQPPRRC